LSDRRQILNFTPVLEMPSFQRPLMRYVASGWRLSTIYSFRTGAFQNITATGGNDFARNGTNTGNQLADYVGGDKIGDNSGRPLSFWFNRAAFANPALGTIGNSGTRQVVLPGHFDFNIALVRSFRLKESQHFEFRWEVYNVTNSYRPPLGNTLPSPGASAQPYPSNELTSPLFGQLRTSDDPRIMQFALKYLF
jgi:hypothetical protein